MTHSINPVESIVLPLLVDTNERVATGLGINAAVAAHHLGPTDAPVLQQIDRAQPAEAEEVDSPRSDTFVLQITGEGAILQADASGQRARQIVTAFANYRAPTHPDQVRDALRLVPRDVWDCLARAQNLDSWDDARERFGDAIGIAIQTQVDVLLSHIAERASSVVEELIGAQQSGEANQLAGQLAPGVRRFRDHLVAYTQEIDWGMGIEDGAAERFPLLAEAVDQAIGERPFENGFRIRLSEHSDHGRSGNHGRAADLLQVANEGFEALDLPLGTLEDCLTSALVATRRAHLQENPNEFGIQALDAVSRWAARLGRLGLAQQAHNYAAELAATAGQPEAVAASAQYLADIAAGTAQPPPAETLDQLHKRYPALVGAIEDRIRPNEQTIRFLGRPLVPVRSLTEIRFGTRAEDLNALLADLIALAGVQHGLSHSNPSSPLPVYGQTVAWVCAATGLQNIDALQLLLRFIHDPRFEETFLAALLNAQDEQARARLTQEIERRIAELRRRQSFDVGRELPDEAEMQAIDRLATQVVDPIFTELELFIAREGRSRIAMVRELLSDQQAQLHEVLPLVALEPAEKKRLATQWYEFFDACRRRWDNSNLIAGYRAEVTQAHARLRGADPEAQAHLIDTLVGHLMEIFEDLHDTEATYISLRVMAGFEDLLRRFLHRMDNQPGIAVRHPAGGMLLMRHISAARAIRDYVSNQETDDLWPPKPRVAKSSSPRFWRTCSTLPERSPLHGCTAASKFAGYVTVALWSARTRYGPKYNPTPSTQPRLCSNHSTSSANAQGGWPRPNTGQRSGAKLLIVKPTSAAKITT